MLLIHLTGLSGSDKSHISNGVKLFLETKELKTEVIDGDISCKKLCRDLGSSKEGRNESIRRPGFVAKLPDFIIQNLSA